MKLLIVSHTPHYKKGNSIVGWGPTIREIDYLSQVFDRVVHVAPLHPEAAPASALPYTSDRVFLRPVQPAGGEKLQDKMAILGVVPHYLRIISQEIKQCDVVHVRCPAGISLLAVIALGLLKRPLYRWVKYAGNWQPSSGSPWSYTFQRWWLQKRLHQGIVSVNGRWPGQPEHIYSFSNPSLTLGEFRASQELGKTKKFRPPFHLLFVGRVETSKGAGRVLQVARELKKNGLDFVVDFIGDGPERSVFEEWSKEHGLASSCAFHGWLPRSALSEFYARAHFLVFPSDSEGWPKVLSEAMAFGAVPIAGAVSSIPQILGETGAGLAVPPLDVNAFVQAVLDYTAHPGRWQAASRAGLAAAPRFTYEHYLQVLSQTFQDAWGIRLLS
jgi:glycosyltransferase involved in cell wall biosynthesis